MLYALLVLSLTLCVMAAAEQALPQTPPPKVEPAAVPKPGAPPMPSATPVDVFRRMLTMPAAEREQFLATRTPEQRQIIQFKLSEYQAMAAEERERRLQELQVRVYVRQLIKMPGTNRSEVLNALSPVEKEMVQTRLAEWDQLPTEVQKEVIANEGIILRIARSRPPMPAPNFGRTQQEEQMAADLERWRNLPGTRKEELLTHFQNFFSELSDREREKALNILGEAERQQMLRTLEAFERLPNAQRDRCISGFNKFAELSAAERQKFLVNANYWQNMSPKERQTWRVLVSKMSLLSAPPLPPGAKNPPMPPAGAPHAIAGTNGKELSGP